MNEVRQAAERLRRLEFSDETMEQVYPDDDWEVRFNDDMDIVSDAYLRLTDETAIDNDVLLRFGFTNPDECPPQWLQLGPLETHPEFTNREGDRRWNITGNRSQWTSLPLVLKPKTVGQLRLLCILAGIELQEPAT